MITTSFVIGSLSNLQIAGTDIKFWTFDFSAVWTFGMIAARPWLSHRLGKYCADDSNFILMGKWCLHASAFVLIESSSKLLVIRTSIKALASLIFILALWFSWPKPTLFDWLCWGLTTRQPLRVILCRLPEKGRKETEERVEEMKERDREERRTGMKVKKQKK